MLSSSLDQVDNVKSLLPWLLKPSFHILNKFQIGNLSQAPASNSNYQCLLDTLNNFLSLNYITTVSSMDDQYQTNNETVANKLINNRPIYLVSETLYRDNELVCMSNSTGNRAIRD